MPFVKKNNQLILRQGPVDLPLKEFVKNREEAFYLYDLNGIEERLQHFRTAFSGPVHIHYAMKANSHPLILQALAQLGVGVDVVSGGELELALQNGFQPQQIVFSGVGKTQKEITRAIGTEIKQINIESPAELLRVAAIARQQRKRARVAWRLNPEVDSETHPYIKTALTESKFGMEFSLLPTLLEILKTHQNHLDLRGLTLHIGSQLRQTEPIAEAIRKTLPVFQFLESEGHRLSTFDVGGGIGLNYEDPQEAEQLAVLKRYAQEVETLVRPTHAEILCEPGRILVAPFGVLLARVEYVKSTVTKTFAIVNTGMHHLLRPALYQAYHRIQRVEEPKSVLAQKLYDIVGPICESADVLGFERQLTELHEGDWLAISEAGAYGAVMASRYNAHSWPEELVIKDGKVCN